jgi:hypothetical protein
MCLLVRVTANLIDRLVRNNGGTMVSKRNEKNSEIYKLQCHFIHHEPHLKSPVIEYRRTWGSSVSIVSDYTLDDWVTGVRSPAEAKDFSSSLCPDQL